MLPGVILVWIGLSAVVLVGLAAWQGHAYWEYSDGVYSLSARQVLAGRSLYRDFAAAQPPSLYYAAAGALSIDDSPGAIRVAMALCEAVTSLLVLTAVRRLTGMPRAALLAGLVSFVTPWALREHAQLLPETVAAPLILGAALAGSRRRTSAVGGALGAASASFKLAFIVPALAIALLSRDARRGVSGFAAAGGILAVLFVGIFRGPLLTDTIRAQAQTGHASLPYLLGLWSQAAWNVLPLLILAGIAWLRRREIADPDLARSVVAASVGSLLLLATLLKHGSYLTVMVVAEPPLLCLGAAGVALTLRRRPAAPATKSRWGDGAMLAAVAVGAAQAVSLIIVPAHPTIFTRPFAASDPGRTLSSATVETWVADIRRCPEGAAYPGPPYLAFLADRRVAGGEPDPFMIQHAPVLARFRRAASNDPSICHTAPT